MQARIYVRGVHGHHRCPLRCSCDRIARSLGYQVRRAGLSISQLQMVPYKTFLLTTSFSLNHSSSWPWMHRAREIFLHRLLSNLLTACRDVVSRPSVCSSLTLLSNSQPLISTRMQISHADTAMHAEITRLMRTSLSMASSQNFCKYTLRSSTITCGILHISGNINGMTACLFIALLNQNGFHFNRVIL